MTGWLRSIFIIFVVYAYGCSAAFSAENYNVAPAGTATQNSVAYGGVPSRANDGNTNGIYNNGSVQHSGSAAAQNWWQVELTELKHIDTIETWNRTDCCVSRTTNFHVFVSDVPFTGTTIASSQAQAGVSEYHFTGTMGRPTSFNINRTGRYIRVQLASVNWLHVAEVVVIGDDPSPSMTIVKTANDTTDVVLGQAITYTYTVTNTGNMPIDDVSISDSHNGSGSAPSPDGETLTTDNGVVGDSTDNTANDGVWSVLAPGDVITFTAGYTVTQSDVDNL